MPNLTWTRDRPTVPGWYWMRTQSGAFEEIVEVFRRRGDLYVSEPDDLYPLSGYAGEWAGPLPHPEEPRG